MFYIKRVLAIIPFITERLPALSRWHPLISTKKLHHDLFTKTCANFLCVMSRYHCGVSVIRIQPHVVPRTVSLQAASLFKE